MPSQRRAKACRGTTRRIDAVAGARVDAAIAALKRLGTKKTRDGMARYAIPSDRAFGVPVGAIQKLAKRLGRSHALAEGLWASGWYEARLLATFVDEPDLVTVEQMERWCKDFDNWAIGDTACFHLFDRTRHAFRKIAPWSRRRGEFQKRAAFALLGCLALHRKDATDADFMRCVPLIERGAADERNFVKKGVSWALRSLGSRNAVLHAAAVELAKRLAASDQAAARWIGKDAQRDLGRPLVKRRFEARARASK